MWAKSTDRNKLTVNQWFCHSNLVTDFATLISSQSEGLGKTALGIVKYAYDCSSQLIDLIWFAISLFVVSLSRSVVMDPQHEALEETFLPEIFDYFFINSDPNLTLIFTVKLR